MWFNIFFFFKQKTAYEITVRDWSSDVCSSDLPSSVEKSPLTPLRSGPAFAIGGRSEERRVGKSVDCCVDLGGRRIIKKKKKNKHERYVRQARQIEQKNNDDAA